MKADTLRGRSGANHAGISSLYGLPRIGPTRDIPMESGFRGIVLL